jgi:hypothetical protein
MQIHRESEGAGIGENPAGPSWHKVAAYLRVDFGRR